MGGRQHFKKNHATQISIEKEAGFLVALKRPLSDIIRFFPISFSQTKSLHPEQATPMWPD